MARRDAHLSKLSPRGDFGGRWLWFFPAAYALHAVEEVAGGEGYAAWISRLSGEEISAVALAGIHAALSVALLATITVVRRHRRFYWVVTGIAGIFLGNALLHLIMTWVSASYSPGLATGLLTWLPLAVITWLRAWRRLPSDDLAWGALIGVMGTVVVSVLALNPAMIPLP